MNKFVICAAAVVFASLACVTVLAAPEQLPVLFDPSMVDEIGIAMATLAANTTRDYQMGDKEEYPVVASDIIYQGAAVGENDSGYARPLRAGDVFLGFAEARADNSAGAAGAVHVNVRKRGNIVLPIAGLAVSANDRTAIYASDDDTFTRTKARNSLIGYVSRWVSTGVAVVEFDTAVVRAALQD